MTTAIGQSGSVWHDSKATELPSEAREPRLTGALIRRVMVDDDDQFREAVGGELGDLGFQVTDFGDGASALDYFAQGNSADIVVLDWKLRGQSGMDILRQLRRRGVNLPVAFLTGFPAESIEAVALDGGALDFVDKT